MNNRSNPGGALSRRPQTTMTRPMGGNLGSGWEPWREMEEMQRRMDALFSRFFGAGLPDLFRGDAGADLATVEPEVDLIENDREFIVQAALPGIRPEDINVQVTENTVLITAESCDESEGQGQPDSEQAGGQQGGAPGGQQQDRQQAQQQPIQHLQSRYSRHVRYRFFYTLPQEINPEEVRAALNNGRLELHLPKAQPSQSHTVTVPIQGGDQNRLSAGSTSAQAGSGAQPQAIGTNADQGHQPRTGSATSAPGQSSTQQAQPAASTAGKAGKP